MLFMLKNSCLKSLSFLFIIFLAVSSDVFAKPSFYQSNLSLTDETADNIANDDLSGEDLEIRMAAVEALGKRAGTVVVMNAQTGRIYTIVNQKWAIEDGFKPCSTIKLVTGVAGFNEKLIRTDGNLVNGSYRLGLDDALAYSNNDYFQRVGKNLGSEKMIAYARQLGLGSATGINAANEFAGELPYGNEDLRIYSHADDFRVTPLQLAVLVSAITNGGKILVPHIPRSNKEKAMFQGSYSSLLKIEPTVYERVIPGMMGATKYGTAGRINNTQLNIAGKTGSCIARQTWVGLFASVAPIQNPKFSVVVIMRGQNARGKYSAAVAEKVYRALLPRYNENFNQNLAYKPLPSESAPKIYVEAIAAKEVPIKPNVRKIPEKQAAPIRNTVITYKRDTENDLADENEIKAELPKAVKKTEQKKSSTIVTIEGKTEITRPRIVGNQ